MDTKDLLKHFTFDNLMNSIVTIIIAILLYQIIRIPIKKILNKNDKKTRQNTATYFSVFSSIIRTAYITLVFLVLLKINGFDVSTMLAGVGIASVVIGLAVQDTLKDIIRGISIISEDYFKIGDYVTIGEYSGTVIKPGIRSTKIKDGLTGDVISIANRNIEKVRVASTLISLDIPLPYDLKLTKAEELLNDIAKRAVELDRITDCEYRGITEFANSSINYRLTATSKQGERAQGKRDLQCLILKTMEEYKISGFSV